MMLALNEIVHVDSHVVTQIVEAELVVGTEGDVAVVGLLPGIGIRLMLVDTVYRQAVEHVERAHPLGISLGEVIVDRHDVDSLARKGIEENRECCHKGLSFTGCHLGDLSLMENDTADELDIVVNHVPGDFVAAGHPMVLPDGLVVLDMDEILGYAEVAVEIGGCHRDRFILLEAPGSRLHDGEGLRKYFREFLFDCLILILDYLVSLRRQRLLFRDRNVLLKFRLDTGYLLLEWGLDPRKPGPEGSRPGAEFIIRERVNRSVGGKNLVKNRSDLLEVPVGLGAEDFLQYSC